jgi:hypothetical protein
VNSRDDAPRFTPRMQPWTRSATEINQARYKEQHMAWGPDKVNYLLSQCSRNNRVSLRVKLSLSPSVGLALNSKIHSDLFADISNY